MSQRTATRPPEVNHDSEYCYRNGFENGAWAVLEALRLRTDLVRMRAWAEVDLQQCVHDRSTKANPPKM